MLVISALAGIIATFLPWLEIPLRGSIAGTEGDGLITLLFCAIALLCSLRSPLSVLRRVLVALSGAATTAIGANALSNLLQAREEMRDGSAFAERMAQAISIGAGLYLVIAAGVVLILGTFLTPPPKS